MRAKFALPFVTMILLVCTILMVETERSTGAPQKGVYGKGGGDKKKGPFDPGKFFDSDWMSKGRGYIVISEMKRGREEMELFAKENGISNDKLTKDQFLKYSAQVESLRAKLGKEPGDKKGQKGDKRKDGGDETKKKGPPDEKELDARAEKFFNDADTNGDGFLNEEEINTKTRDLKKDWRKWDENKDNLINLAEFKAYFKASQLQRQKDWEKRAEDKKNGKKVVIEEDDDAEQITVYRLGKMPAGIPDWFKELDLDKDGQISLYEWQRGERDIEDFVKMDRNDDGFLTAEEVVRFQRLVSEAQLRTGQMTLTINGSTANGTLKIKGDLGDFLKKKGNKKGGKDK